MTRLRQFSIYLRALAACLFGMAAMTARAAAPIPPSPAPHYVLDAAHWLNAGQFEALDEQLESFERETSSQILVTILPKVPDGEEMFDFSQHVFEAWKPGLKGKDNGAIFFVFAADHKLHIHTGRGLEGALPDARCKQIISDVVTPLLRKQDQAGAVAAGAKAMMAAAKGEYRGTGHTQLDGRRHGSPRGILITVACVIIYLLLAMRFPALFWIFDLLFMFTGVSRGGWGGGGGRNDDDGGGFSGGGGDSGGGGASGDW